MEASKGHNGPISKPQPKEDMKSGAPPKPVSAANDEEEDHVLFCMRDEFDLGKVSYFCDSLSSE